MKVLACTLGALLAFGCGQSAERPADEPAAGESAGRASWTIGEFDLPAAAGSLAPRLTLPEGFALINLTWTEREPNAAARVLRSTMRQGGEAVFSTPELLVESDDLFVNWADVPGCWSVGYAPEQLAGEQGFGRFLSMSVATWLSGLPEGGYAYHVQRTISGGAPARLHEDDSPTEHGFVSATDAVHNGAGGLQFFWLDGHATGSADSHDSGGHGHGAGAMALRTSFVTNSGVRDEVELDARVCDCCGTAAATTLTGPLVAYRDRSENEVRDISIVRWTGEAWSAPVAVADDGWEIAGCPVNGPAVAAHRDLVAVAWYSGAPTPRVQLAVSRDGGATFDEPRAVLAANEATGRGAGGAVPLGRPALAFDSGDNLQLLHLVELPLLERGSWRLERFSPAELASDPWVSDGFRELTPTSGDREAGFPQLIRASWDALKGFGAGRDLLAVVRDASESPARLRGFWIESDTQLRGLWTESDTE